MGRVFRFLCGLLFSLTVVISMVCSCEVVDIKEPVLPEDPDDSASTEVLPGEITAGEDGELNFKFPEVGVVTEGGFEIVQESVYTDPDGTVHKVESVATVVVKVAKDTVIVNDPSGFVAAATSQLLSSSFDEETRVYTVSYGFTVGPQTVVVDMQSSEPVLENSLGQLVRMPYLKLKSASVGGVETVKEGEQTRAIEITDTTDYKVRVSCEVEAELCNVAEPQVKNVAFDVEYPGRVTKTELYPGQQFSYVLEDRDGVALEYASSYSVNPGECFTLNIVQASSFEDNKGKIEEQLKAWTSLSVSDTLEVANHDEFIAGLQSAVSIESGFDVSSEGLPYFELSEPELVEAVLVDSLDVYPDAGYPATRSVSGRNNIYSRTFVVEGEFEEAQNRPQTRSGASTRAVTAEDMYAKYPHVNSLRCPKRVYTAKATYRQTATLKNSEEEFVLELCYDVTVAGKTQVELVDVEYDANGVVGIFPTMLSGDRLYNQTIVERYRIYSTGEILTDHFESNKTMLFALSPVAVYYQENFDWKYTSWEEADTLDPHIPTIMQVPYDDVPWYDFYSYPSEAEVHRQYHWSVGMDWDILRDTGLGEVNSAVGIPGIHRFDGVDLGEWFNNSEIEKFGKGQYETYLHSDTSENYDSSVNTPGWYTGYLQSRHSCIDAIYFEDDVDPRSCMHSIWVPRMKIDLCIDEKVLCIDDRIFAPKQLLDDKVVEKTVEDAVSPTRGPVKIAKMGLDFTVYDEVFKFRLTDTLYNYYSPHYEWENSGN